MLNFLPGKKTFIAGGLAIIVGVAQLAGIDVPGFTGEAGGQQILEGFAVIALRLGIMTG